MQITRGKMKKAERVVIYGPEGIGKSTFASKFPEPLFIDTEGSTTDLDVARLPAPNSWAMVVEAVNFVRNNPSCCKTLVIDTADWAEKLCARSVCASEAKDSIEDFGYGKGYVKVAEQFGKFLNALTDISNLGIHIVITAHAAMRKFERPDESGAYDRWELKLEKKVAPLLKEWATMLLFANYKIHVVKDKNDKAKAHGGSRVMYTQHHACWDAKNRKGLPEELPFEYEAIASYIALPSTKTEPVSTVSTEAPKNEVEVAEELPTELPKEEPKRSDPLSQLRQLMEEGVFQDIDVKEVVAEKGYYPISTPLENYAPDFIEGALVGAWDQVKAALMKNREEKAPF